MKNKKLTIKQLKVKSFTTQLKPENKAMIKGGLSRFGCGHCLTNNEGVCA